MHSDASQRTAYIIPSINEACDKFYSSLNNIFFLLTCTFFPTRRIFFRRAMT